MRKIIILLAIMFSVSSANAGLFEYYLGEETKSNVKTDSQADVVEKIDVKITPAYQSSYNSYDYGYNRYDRYTGGVTNEVYYRYPYQTYDSDKYIRNGYYAFSQLENELENEAHRLDEELEDIEDRKDDIKEDLRDLRDFRSPYYVDLREELEDELQYLQEREEYLEDLEEDIKDDLKDLRKNKNYRTSRYYYNGSYVYRSYYYNDYYRDRDYYYDNDYYYDDDYYYDYYYHNGKKYRRKPRWVNPNLEDVDDGRIYIK